MLILSIVFVSVKVYKKSIVIICAIIDMVTFSVQRCLFNFYDWSQFVTEVKL